MALFLLNIQGSYWPPLRQRTDGGYTDGVPEQDLPLVHEGEGSSAHLFHEYYPITPQRSGSQAHYPQQIPSSRHGLQVRFLDWAASFNTRTIWVIR